MDSKNFSEAMTYHTGKPDVKSLCRAFDDTVRELEYYFDLCRTSYDDRRNWWPGKTRDHRKHGPDAFPWEGAADCESHVIDERITRLVSLMMSALKRANIRAYPVESGDIGRARLVSNFMKWMVSSRYINRFMEEMELGANYLLERGLLITYVGWQKEDRRYNQIITMDQVANMDPDTANLIQSGTDDEYLTVLMMNAFNGVTEEKAKNAIKELREIGETVLPIVRRQVNAPLVQTLSPDGDFFFPPYVTDPQRSPYCFWRTYYTVQELQGKVVTDGWDKEWVDFVSEKYRGVNIDSIDREQEGRRSVSLTESSYEAEELVEVIHGYQRLINPDDGSEGIYCTVYHREFFGSDDVPGYAKFELMNGYENYPIEVTKLSEDNKRLYDTITLPDLLRGIQNLVKVERDSRIDRNSISTVPPILHPVGNAPTDWGPARLIPYRRKGDFDFAPTPPPPTGSMEIEATLTAQADRLVGLDETSQISQVRKQFLVDKFLTHCSRVLASAYRAFQRYGPDSIFFRVTGSPNPDVFNKGDPDENFDITISYDVLNTDPETQRAKLQEMVSLVQLDRNGRINMDSLLDVVANSIDPVLADAVLQPSEAGYEQVVRQVTDDLAKIFAGIEMPARPNGSQIAMQVIQEYLNQPDIAQRKQADQMFSDRIDKYVGQYVFQMQQSQNAQIGKIGTMPAGVGSVNMQNNNGPQ